jgi:membrane associated rhomboid family serine protease
MKTAPGRLILVCALLVGFGIEMATNSIGRDAALLRLGALPDNGELDCEFWRLITYSFLHFSSLHLIANAGLLLWIGRIVEARVGTAQMALIYFVSVLCSAAVILLVHSWRPKSGATVGASGAIFGLLGAALVISYRQDAQERLRRSIWIVLIAGLGISLLPDISLAGHMGGIAGGVPAAFLVNIPKDEY